MNIEEIRAQFPQYDGVSDFDLLMGLHKTYYPNVHVKTFLSRIDGASDLPFTRKGSKMAGYYEQQVQIPMEGETDAQAGERAAGTSYGIGEVGQGQTAARSGLQGLTFGGGDEAVAGAASLLSGNAYDFELAKERKRLEAGREAFPKTAIASEIAGAVAVPVGGMKSTGKLGYDIAKSAAVGGGLSGAYGFLSGEGGAGERADNALWSGLTGAGLGAAIPVAGAAINGILQNRATKKAIGEMAKSAPTTEELRAAGNAAYKAVDDAGVQIKPEVFDATRAKITDMLRANTGFDELPGPGSLTPNAARVMEIMGQSSAKMAAEPTAALPFKSLDQMRRQAGAAAGNVANKTDAKAGMGIIEGLDDMVNRLSPDDVVAGDVEALKTLIPKARETWARMTKSQLVDDAIEAGNGNYLSGGASGLRNQFKALLTDKKLARGFTDLEKAAMRRVVKGTMPEQLLNLFGGGIGQLATIGGGYGAGGLPGFFGGMGIAAGARKASEAITNRNAEIVRALVANGGTNALPAISQTPRSLIEAMLRRGAAPVSQPQ